MYKNMKGIAMNKKSDNNIITKFKILYVIVTIIISFICGIYFWIYRINHSWMTETQFTIYALKNYWWLYIMVLGLGVIKFK